DRAFAEDLHRISPRPPPEVVGVHHQILSPNPPIAVCQESSRELLHATLQSSGVPSLRNTLPSAVSKPQICKAPFQGAQRTKQLYPHNQHVGRTLGPVDQLNQGNRLKQVNKSGTAFEKGIENLLQRAGYLGSLRAHLLS